jgi:soluble lytic murein transglycosylase-like protein
VGKIFRIHGQDAQIQEDDMDPDPIAKPGTGAFPPKSPLKRIASFFLLLILLFPSVSSGFERFNSVTKYDRYFLRYSKKYFGEDFDWQYFKAQAIAESGLKPLAKSSCGAKGVMQLMPATFREVAGKHKIIKGDLRDPESNVAAGIIYNHLLWSRWEGVMDRLAFMFASYNAGTSNIVKARKLAAEKGKNPNLWSSVSETLPQVTGEKSMETIRYVDKIFQVKKVLR